MSNNKQTPDPFAENLLQQITNISKAHGYDILSEQVGELKAENEALKKSVEVLRALENGFYMAICRAYNAGKQNMTETVNGGESYFNSSHDYFKIEYPEFTTNVP
jgi:predicted secreted protein